MSWILHKLIFLQLNTSSRNLVSPLILNLGTGTGTSVFEIITAFEIGTKITIPYEIGDSRMGDLAEFYSDLSLAKEILGWSASYSIEDMCQDAWNWQSRNPLGYDTLIALE